MIVEESKRVNPDCPRCKGKGTYQHVGGEYEFDSHAICGLCFPNREPMRERVYRVTVDLTGSLWKGYRSAELSIDADGADRDYGSEYKLRRAIAAHYGVPVLQVGAAVEAYERV